MPAGRMGERERIGGRECRAIAERRERDGCPMRGLPSCVVALDWGAERLQTGEVHGCPPGGWGKWTCKTEEIAKHLQIGETNGRNKKKEDSEESSFYLINGCPSVSCYCGVTMVRGST